MKGMFEAIIKKNETKIKELDEIARNRINDVKSLYEKSELKEKKMKELEAKVQVIGKDLEKAKEQLRQVENNLETKENEYEECTQDLNNSKLKERDLFSENLRLKEKYDKQKTRFDLLEKAMNTGEKSKE